MTFLLLLVCWLGILPAGWAQGGDDGLPREERVRLGLPLAEPVPMDQVIRPTPEDEALAASLPAEVFGAIDEYVKTRRQEIFHSAGNVTAAHRIGDHLLLWVHEPGVMDGGFELIYSEEKRRIVGTFFTGYKG
ncbi:MAG: hypothetical protein GX442_08785 [Candidatus Riflebacteria bacterium]|nr:hypothetical protein [Candidatus Riflebacteria bacterium]